MWSWMYSLCLCGFPLGVSWLSIGVNYCWALWLIHDVPCLCPMAAWIGLFFVPYNSALLFKLKLKLFLKRAKAYDKICTSAGLINPFFLVQVTLEFRFRDNSLKMCMKSKFMHLLASSSLTFNIYFSTFNVMFRNNVKIKTCWELIFARQLKMPISWGSAPYDNEQILYVLHIAMETALYLPPYTSWHIPLRLNSSATRVVWRISAEMLNSWRL